MFRLPMNSSAASTGKVGSATVLAWPTLLSAPMMRVSPALETFSGARASSGATAGVNKTFAVTERQSLRFSSYALNFTNSVRFETRKAF